jgi:acyl carrier protein
MSMSESTVRELVVGSLLKVLDLPSNSARSLRLQSTSGNPTIAELAIDSLDAIEWCMEIESRGGIELDPAELSPQTSMNELVSLVIERTRVSALASRTQLVRTPRNASLPLTFAQERIWRYSQTPQACAAYVLSMQDHILGQLDVVVLRECLSYIVKRHEILRTTFAVVDGQPVHVIHPPEPIALPVFQLASECDRKAEIARVVRAEMSRIRDLTEPLLLRFALMRVNEKEHWLLRICHHILWDSWSTKLLLGELAVLYQAKLDGTAPPLPHEEPLGYVDYAAWQRKVLDGDACRLAVAWWGKRFQHQGARADLPFRRSTSCGSIMPADGVIRRLVEAPVAERLSRLAGSAGATIYMVWLAAFVALLAAETGRPGVVVGSYATSRRRAELRKMIGYFSNLATLCFKVDHAMPFCNWLTEVASCVADAEANCDIPREQLEEELQRLGIAAPEVHAIFGAPMGEMRADMHFGGLTLSRPDWRPSVAVMPWGFSLNLHEHANTQVCVTTFDAAIYDPNAVRRFVDRLHEFLDAISRHPDLPVSGLLAICRAGQDASVPPERMSANER